MSPSVDTEAPFAGPQSSLWRGSDSQIPRVFPPFPSQMFKKAPDLGFLPTLTAQPGSRLFSLEKSQYDPCPLIFSKSSGFWGHTVGLGQSFLLPSCTYDVMAQGPIPQPCAHSLGRIDPISLFYQCHPLPPLGLRPA